MQPKYPAARGVEPGTMLDGGETLELKNLPNGPDSGLCSSLPLKDPKTQRFDFVRDKTITAPIPDFNHG